MSRLRFEDIDEWTPSSISIVDVPAHPLCKFEVYDDDTEFVKKSIEIQNEGEIMVEPQNKEETQMMTVSEGFFERMLNRVVGKSEEAPEKPPIKEEPKTDISALVARIEKLEAEVAELKKEEKPKEEEKPEAPAEAVAKSESEGETSEATSETTEESEPEVVMKSKSLDPDTITTSAESDKSLVERAGRKTNGMSW